MSFYGDRFIFDGIPCEEFGLMLYDIGSTRQQPTSFASNSDFMEDRIGTRYDPLFYGIRRNSQLNFQMTFGLDPEKVNAGVYFDRWDMEKIASWLTGRDGYKWLVIGNEDEGHFRYRCRISDLKIVEAGIYPQCMSCSVTCDSPYAYLPEETFTYEVSGSLELVFHNRSTHNGWYCPKVELTLSGAPSFSIQNDSDGGRISAFTDIPAGFANAVISIDNQNQIITSSTGDNLYPYFNKKFFRLARGDNRLKITGTGKLKILCSFPVNVGG